MQLIIIIALVVLGSTVFFNKTKSSVSVPETLGASTVQDTLTPAPSHTPEPTNNPTPTVLPRVNTSTPKPTTIPVQNISLMYPGSQIISTNHYTSSDDSEKITNWYKDQIRSMGFNTKSFVTTSTNGNILNKLSAAKSGSNISVEISKSESSNQVSITLLLDN